MSSLFPSSARFRAAVQLINAADPTALAKVLGRLLLALPDKVMRADHLCGSQCFSLSLFAHCRCVCCNLSRAQGTNGFSAEETEQMQSIFGLSDTQVDTLLGSSAFILEQAAYYTTPPEDLRTDLLSAGLAEDAARAFSSTWQAGASACVQQLKESSVLSPLQLSGVDWQLCVGSAASDGERGQTAHALLQLDLAPPPGATAGGGEAPGEERRAVHLRMGRAELEGLLSKLDLIQAQMDRLT